MKTKKIDSLILILVLFIIILGIFIIALSYNYNTNNNQVIDNNLGNNTSVIDTNVSIDTMLTDNKESNVSEDIGKEVSEPTNSEHSQINDTSETNSENSNISKPESSTSSTIVREDIKATDKLIALTFDDGPAPGTNRLLDILEKEDVKVTFFMVGYTMDNYQDVMKRMAKDGHQLASHTYDHPNLTKLSNSELRYQIDTTTTKIKTITGVDINALRPPYGAHNESVRNAINMPVIMWSLDSRDWEAKDADIVYNRIVSEVKDGDIILLHDLHQTSIDAAARVIPELKSRGYTFVTVEELIKLREGEPVSSKAYHNLLPPTTSED